MDVFIKASAFHFICLDMHLAPKRKRHSSTALIDQCIDYHMQMTIYFLVFCIFTMVGAVLTLQTVFHLFLHPLKKCKERAEARQAVWLAQAGRRVCLDKRDYRPSSCKTSEHDPFSHPTVAYSFAPATFFFFLYLRLCRLASVQPLVQPEHVRLLKPYIKMPSSQGACIQLQGCSKWDFNDLNTLLFRNPEEKVAPLWLSLPPLKVISLVVRTCWRHDRK